MSRWVLNLGDVRSRDYRLVAMCWAETREALEKLVADETVTPYMRAYEDDHAVRCFFREGGPLEWCLPPWIADDRHYVEVPDIKQYLLNCGKDYKERFDRLPQVPAPAPAPA